MNTPKQRWRPRLWTIMSIISALILALTVGIIVLTYQTSLESVYRRELRQQLSGGLELLQESDYSAAAIDEVRAEGIRLLLLSDDGSHTILAQDAGGEPMGFPRGEDRNDGPAEDERSPAAGKARALEELVVSRLGSAEGSFYITELDPGAEMAGPNHRFLYLAGRADGRLFCLFLPVESTNAAVNIAIRFATIVGLAAWLASVVLLYFMSRMVTKPYGTIVRTAGQIAEMDFSQRCPPAVSLELDELSNSVNRMSDRLQANVEGLRQANEQLQAELSERVRQQQISTELIANLSHDLKTPVAVISGYAEGLQEGVARTPEQQQTYYSMILKESEHMQALIWKLLAQSRLDSGEIPLEIEEFDLADLLDDTLDAFQREIERLELAVERDYFHPTPVRSDYESIRQSVGNYVQNAVLHINGGNRIRISTERHGALIRLRVANSSAPIPAEEAGKIWNRLYRGDPARQRHQGEAGLGLRIVKGNMDRLGLACGQRNLDGMVEFWLDVPDAAEDLPPDSGIPSDN